MSKKVIVPKIGGDPNSGNPNDFIFHSDYNSFKIIAEGKLTSQTVSANPTTLTVAHGQSITPAIYAYIKYPDGYIAMASGAERADTYPLDRYCWVEVDGTNIYFLMYKGSGSNYSVSVKYFIFETPL